MAKPTGPRVLFWDIETSLMPVAVFQLSNQDWIDPSNILQERYIICASWMWEGDSKIHSVSVLDDPKRYAKDPHDDYHVIKTLHEVLSQANVVVHHNGDSFDLRYAKTRMLAHKLPPLPPMVTVDTYKTAKSQFMLNSNKLDYIGALLGLGQKLKTSPGLWIRVLNGDAKAVREMVTYNKQDVLLLKDVFYALAPHMPNHFNRELFGQVGCPRCGCTKVQSRGTEDVYDRHTAISRVYRRFQCQNPKCKGWFRSVTNDKSVKPQFRVI